MDLYEELQQKTKELDIAIKMLRNNGSEYAEAERDYKIKVAKKALELKSGGMAITLINLVIYGDKEVAELRFKRDVKEATYKANIESINSTKLQLRLIESQLSREYGGNGQ